MSWSSGEVNLGLLKLLPTRAMAQYSSSSIPLRSIHNTPQLRWDVDIYVNYISATSHRSIIAFLVKMNLTFMQHRTVVTSHECAVQRNCAATPICSSHRGTALHNDLWSWSQEAGCVSFLCKLFCIFIWLSHCDPAQVNEVNVKQ